MDKHLCLKTLCLNKPTLCPHTIKNNNTHFQSQSFLFFWIYIPWCLKITWHGKKHGHSLKLKINPCPNPKVNKYFLFIHFSFFCLAPPTPPNNTNATPLYEVRVYLHHQSNIRERGSSRDTSFQSEYLGCDRGSQASMVSIQYCKYSLCFCWTKPNGKMMIIMRWKFLTKDT